MSWTGAYDKVSFLAPIRRRKVELLAALKEPGVDNDAARVLLDGLQELGDFVQAIKRIDGPAAELVPVSGVGPQSGCLYMLQVGEWRGFYLMSDSTKAYYGVLVTHREMPVGARLDELQIPGGGAAE
ncbi:MAG: hypothetical protein QM674_06245 [Burkholderiaceae bacterium]